MLNSVLLVLDSHIEEAKSLLTGSGMSNEVVDVAKSKEAINYLRAGNIPDLIILDINLPVDFECIFLHEFNKLPDEIQNHSKILVVTNRKNEHKLSGFPLNKHVIATAALPLEQGRIEEIVAMVSNPT